MRDVAISIVSREEHSFMVKCDKPLEDWSEFARRQNYAVISSSLTGMRKLPGDLKFPKLQILQLLCEGEVLDTPDSFFEGMTELKVVTVSNVNFRLMLTSFQFMTNPKTLSLSKCEWIDDVSVIGALTNLEILRKDFFRSFVKLSKLEELYIGESVHKWNVVEQSKEGTNASIAELASLSNLVALKINVQLDDVKFWPKDLDLRKVE
ncbi:hypothetical protein U1Q18_023065, partial [Sarracenia purpurea var. burkii]